MIVTITLPATDAAMVAIVLRDLVRSVHAPEPDVVARLMLVADRLHEAVMPRIVVGPRVRGAGGQL